MSLTIKGDVNSYIKELIKKEFSPKIKTGQDRDSCKKDPESEEERVET